MLKPEKKPDSLRTVPSFPVSQNSEKDHCVYSLFWNSREKWIVTDCYSKIVTKVHAFPMSLVVRALQRIFGERFFKSLACAIEWPKTTCST